MHPASLSTDSVKFDSIAFVNIVALLITRIDWGFYPRVNDSPFSNF